MAPADVAAQQSAGPFGARNAKGDTACQTFWSIEEVTSRGSG